MMGVEDDSCTTGPQRIGVRCAEVDGYVLWKMCVKAIFGLGRKCPVDMK